LSPDEGFTFPTGQATQCPSDVFIFPASHVEEVVDDDEPPSFSTQWAVDMEATKAQDCMLQ
jgi:hypothetical protein